MSIKQKIAIYLGLIVLLIFVLLLWGFFAYKGKTDIQPLISQLGVIAALIMTALGAVGGFHSGQASQAGSTLLTAGSAFLSSAAELALPVAEQSASPTAATVQPAAAIPAATLQ